jgi:hypothetical protein
VFLQIFGAGWLLLEPLALWRPESLDWGARGYLALAGASLLVAVAYTWPKTCITRRLAVSDTRITVQTGNVLDRIGNIVVGVSDVFDTELGDVISPQSVQGQFQARYFPNTPELDAAIAQSLLGQHAEPDGSKARGKNLRYKIGTVATIRHGVRRFFLSAYTTMGSNLQAQSNICDLTTSLEACWNSIRAAGQHEPVHMPVIGSRFARTGLPRALLIQFIILSFLNEERRASLTSHLHIHIAEQDAQHVDFVVLENWLAEMTRAV